VWGERIEAYSGRSESPPIIVGKALRERRLSFQKSAEVIVPDLLLGLALPRDQGRTEHIAEVYFHAFARNSITAEKLVIV
jgi:hypothetical protein